METRSSICSRRLYLAGWGVVVWGWGRAHRFTGGALCLAGRRGRRARRLSGGVCALIVGWRCFGLWAGGEGEVVARIVIRVVLLCVSIGEGGGVGVAAGRAHR